MLALRTKMMAELLALPVIKGEENFTIHFHRVTEE